MIQVFGADDTREYAAALQLRDMISRAWPHVLKDAGHDIRIIAGAKCHGQATRDIDLLLLANLGAGIEYTPFLAFTDGAGHLHQPKTVQVVSLCIAIEVKDHPAENVRFFGTTVEVLYQGHWHNASEQNEKQRFAIKHYLERQGIQAPWIAGLLWLRNMPNTEIPSYPHNIIGAPASWDLMLNVIGQEYPPRWKDGAWTLTATNYSPHSLVRAAELFTKVIEPTQLDRRRMERINQQSTDLVMIAPDLGHKLIILRGRGGTGKTLRLIQLAKRLYDEQAARILILTYNKALVADIRRLLTILGISDDTTTQAIYIRTVHSFLRSVLQDLGIMDADYATFLDDYEQLKDEALDFFREGTVTHADVARLQDAGREAFQWDYIFIDEGQDWPDNERDLILRLYPAEHVVVADGVDQLVRRPVSTDWRHDHRNDSRVIPLKRSLRMKAGIARFVSAVARNLGLLSSEWEANEELPGGHIIIVEGSYLSERALHDRLLHDNARDGNQPIDMLFCVPPGVSEQDGADPIPHGGHSNVSGVFETWGFHTWDGTAEDVREGYPTDVDQLRIVQYDSCRGLEGWTVVSLSLDRFYDYKLATFDAWSGRTSSASDAVVGNLASDGTKAAQYAARWLLIPLTRAMDTLVIHLDRPQTAIRNALEMAANECADYVEWIKQ